MNDEIKNMLREILSSVRSLEDRIARIESGESVAPHTPTSSSAGGKRISVKEFLIQCKPGNAVQTTLAIAYFLETYEDVVSLNVADLESGFRAAKETVPANINDKINMCVKNGHLMEDKAKKDSKKAWVVTRSGEQYVLSHFGRIDDKK